LHALQIESEASRSAAEHAHAELLAAKHRALEQIRQLSTDLAKEKEASAVTVAAKEH
jgi:hypothetical protein